jgi:hypothetical protein
MPMITQARIRWTRLADGSYLKEGSLPADISNARIFAIDEDYETNPHAVCPGLKLWPKEEAVELVERKIAEGSYRAWRYEVRAEVSTVETAPAREPVPPERPSHGLCSNERCRKGPDGNRGVLKSSRAKYCCTYCRVDVCRRSRPKPAETEKATRKRRKDAKYSSHSERQRAHYARHRYLLPQPIKDYLAMRATRPGVAVKRVSEPV